MSPIGGVDYRKDVSKDMNDEYERALIEYICSESAEAVPANIRHDIANIQWRPKLRSMRGRQQSGCRSIIKPSLLEPGSTVTTVLGRNGTSTVESRDVGYGRPTKFQRQEQRQAMLDDIKEHMAAYDISRERLFGQERGYRMHSPEPESEDGEVSSDKEFDGYLAADMDVSDISALPMVDSLRLDQPLPQLIDPDIEFYREETLDLSSTSRSGGPTDMEISQDRGRSFSPTGSRNIRLFDTSPATTTTDVGIFDGRGNYIRGGWYWSERDSILEFRSESRS